MQSLILGFSLGGSNTAFFMSFSEYGNTAKPIYIRTIISFFFYQIRPEKLLNYLIMFSTYAMIQFDLPTSY